MTPDRDLTLGCLVWLVLALASWVVVLGALDWVGML